MLNKKRISKDSGRVVLHKYKISDINQYSEIEKEHIITKIKKHEKFYTFCLSSFFFLLFTITIVIMGTSFNYYLDANKFTSGDLEINYVPQESNLGNVITLNDSSIKSDLIGKEEDNYKFTITNKSNDSKKYKIVLREDTEIEKYDNCKDRLININNIHYNINKGNIKNLSDLKSTDNKYILVEDIIPGSSTKVYTINMWEDENVKQENRHFHAILDIVSLN